MNHIIKIRLAVRWMLAKLVDTNLLKNLTRSLVCSLSATQPHLASPIFNKTSQLGTKEKSTGGNKTMRSRKVDEQSTIRPVPVMTPQDLKKGKQRPPHLFLLKTKYRRSIDANGRRAFAWSLSDRN